MGEAMDLDSGCGSVFDSPRCLISSEADGKLCVVEPVLKQISELQKDLVIISIAGLYRTGKSYLMNRLFGVNKGFALGSKIQAVTKGIWVWIRIHPANPDKYLILLDTEGLGDVKKGDATQDSWIFCLATLLPSVLVYNAMPGIIDDKALENLHFISKMSEHIKTREDSQRGEDADLDYYFPDFIFVLRDFYLQLELDGIEITADQYLEDCLASKAGNEGKNKKFNEVRHSIRRYFRNRKCFTLDRPGNKRQLADLERLTDSQLSPDFVEEVQNFCNYVLEHAPTKKLENGKAVSGAMWCSLVTSYTKAISSGELPCIESAISSMAVVENTKAVNEAVAVYKQQVEKIASLPLSDSDLSNIHNEALKTAIKHFLEKSVFDVDAEYQERANELILQEYGIFVRANEAASETKCAALLTSLEEPLTSKLKSGGFSKSGGYQDYLSAVQAINQQYTTATGLGVKAQQVLLKYMQQKMREGESIMAGDREITEREKTAAAEQHKALVSEQNAAAARREKQLVEQQAKEKEAALNENMRQAEEKHATDIQSIQEHQDSVINSRLDEQKRLISENFEKEAASLRQQITQLQNRPPVVHRKKKKCVIQ